MGNELLLVGSVPLDTPQHVLELCGRTLGDRVGCLPDGETGDRRNWIDFLALQVYADHPQLEVVNRPQGGRFSDRKSFWAFKAKPGVRELSFDDMGYARESIASYETFKRLRSEGTIAPDVRFQVGLPLTGSGVDNFFRDTADWELVRPAYEAGMRREIDRMLEHIPADDLAIQWDVCVELLDIFGAIPWAPDLSEEEKILRHVDPMDRVSVDIDEDVMLGFHFCYGTLGGWPMVDMKDLSLAVRLANEAVARSGRRVDFLHMPVIPGADDDHFRPLRDLDVGSSRVFLGVIHHSDGVEGFRERVQLARRHLSEFGVASVCGYGRLEPEVIPEVLALHRECADALHEVA
jgi:hypothetical protein